MSQKARVLFVDDEERVLNSLRGMFRRKFDLFLTTEGSAAVKIAAENPIDVIVADQRMPGMTGIEVLGKVRELSPGTIRILLTGYANPSAVEGSINVGEVFRYLCKPCPPQVLSDTLDLAIEATRPIAEIPISAADPDREVTTRNRVGGNFSSTDRASASSNSTSERNVVEDRDRRIAHMETGRSATALRSDRETPDKSFNSSADVDFRLVARDSPDSNDVYIRYGTTAEARQVGVVIYTVDAFFAETAIRTLSPKRNTTLATSFIKVMQTIEQDLAGILITDFSTNRTRLQRMIGALKQYLPELVTIVVSDSRDTTEMIGLINYGQVFRYILKPVSPLQLANYIDAATYKHLTLRNNPNLLKRHTVEKHAGFMHSSNSMNQIFSRIQSL